MPNLPAELFQRTVLCTRAIADGTHSGAVGVHGRDFRSELERRVAADGYKLADIFPELGSANGSAARRQKRPAKYRNPQNPEESWSGIGRSPKWVQVILEERGIDVAAFKAIPMYQIHA